MKKQLFTLILCLFCTMAIAQTDDQRPETDPVITQRISQWQDLKFGFMMHWGIYAIFCLAIIVALLGWSPRIAPPTRH